MNESSPGFLAKLASSLRGRRSNAPAERPPSSASTAKSPSPLPYGVELVMETAEEREAHLNSLPDVYFDPPGHSDTLDHELKELPLAVNADELEAAADRRTTSLEIVSEKLTQHILRNYDAFAEGVQEVIGVEELVEAAMLRTKVAREQLALASGQVSKGVGVWRNTQRKRALSSLLEVLLQVRRAAELADALEVALSEGDFCGALWLCDLCATATATLGSEVRVAGSLEARALSGFGEALAEMRGTLSALATDFQPESARAILQGYALLAASRSVHGIDVDPGRDALAAFSAAPAAAAQKVLRGVLLVRPGLEEAAAAAPGLQALVALLPSDLFRICLARVMMVVWDILAAHHAMEEWHVHTDTMEIASGWLSGRSSPKTSENLAAAAEGDEMSSCGDGGVQAAEDDALREALSSVQKQIAEGLNRSRGRLWEEASRVVGVLLGSPGAVDGEHFMQVVAWTERLVGAGEAFSRADASALRGVLQRQAGAFFRAYHESNLEALNSMLDKEVWKRLPVELPLLCDHAAAHAVAGPSSERGEHADGGDRAGGGATAFEELVKLGNPWRKQHRGNGFPGAAPPPSSVPAPRLGFSGASILDDNSRGLEVDENGLHRSSSDRETARSSSADGESATTAAAAADTCTSPSRPFSTTNSSWRVAKWMRDYASLMMTLPGTSPAIFTGICELFDLYVLHVYLAFGGGGLLLDRAAPPGVVASSTAAATAGTAAPESEGLSPELKAALQHIALGSMSKYRGLLTAAHPGSKLARALAPGGAADKGPMAQHAKQADAGSPGRSNDTALAHSGNLYGLVERFAAGDSAVALARALAAARPSLESALPAAEEKIAVESYCERAFATAVELKDALMRQGCRLMLPLHWVPESVAGGPYQASEPPSEPAPWTAQLSRQLELFAAQLDHSEDLAPGVAAAMWPQAESLLVAAMVEGFSRVKRCSLEGRSAMSADLQAVNHALTRRGGGERPGARAALRLRLADDYVKAFYVPLPDLPAWSASHPGYPIGQVKALAACIADSSGMKKKEAAAALAKVEVELSLQHSAKMGIQPSSN